jgi:hypothetical protein
MDGVTSYLTTLVAHSWPKRLSDVWLNHAERGLAKG